MYVCNGLSALAHSQCFIVLLIVLHLVTTGHGRNFKLGCYVCSAQVIERAVELDIYLPAGGEKKYHFPAVGRPGGQCKVAKDARL